MVDGYGSDISLSTLHGYGFGSGFVPGFGFSFGFDFSFGRGFGFFSTHGPVAVNCRFSILKRFSLSSSLISILPIPLTHPPLFFYLP